MLAFLLFIFLSFQNMHTVYTFYENGYLDYSLNFPKKNTTARSTTFLKSMYSDTEISFTVDCHSKSNYSHFKLEVIVEYNPCHHPSSTEKLFLMKSKIKYPCVKYFRALGLKKFYSGNGKEISKLSKGVKKQKRDDEKVLATTTEKPKAKAGSPATTTKKPKAKGETGATIVHTTNKTGMYFIILKFTPVSGNDEEMVITGRIKSTRGGSYLSAITYPLLPFYGVMSIVYLMYGIVWFCCSCCNWKDILRVQFWVGGVIALGMFENAVYYSEYQSVSSHGRAFDLLYFAEIVSSAKRALARVLVIIVSIGFGIVKPRLGQTLQKVMVIGGLFFVLSSIEGCIRVKDHLEMYNRKQIFALVPLTVVDVAICWWIFTALVQTTRTLRIRKNVVKLTLYKHFTNILIFTVLVSLAYMVYTIKESKFSECVNISMFWLQEALWPFLFALILAVIMFLWRPSVNNQRYAFTPLDMGADDDDDMTLSDAFEGMKMRNKSESTTTAKNRRTADEDLRWVEENIPSVPSTLLPTIDSDEEILTTKFEVSKMN